MQYTNTVRANNGEKPLIHGTQSQLDNALRYAKVLASKKTLQHQTLPAVTKEVKCLRWIGGENLAFNYEKGDIARACVQQWIASRKHWDNLVRPWFEEMVVGVHIRFDGRVYCVQTFAVFFPRHSTFGTRDGPKCHQVVAP